MTYFITVEELKQTTFNANLDNEYIVPALEEAQSIYLREILGDLLYSSIENRIDSDTLNGKYLTLVNQYIKPYLTYKVQSVIVIPLNNKTRNAGIVNQYDQGFNTTTMKDTAYLAEHYDSRAEFYANRLTTYLQKNAADFPEYGYSDDNVTQPTTSQNVTGIYLGKSGSNCGCMTPSRGGGGGGQADSVEWDNILHKPQPTIGAGVVTLVQGGTTQSFNVNATENTTIELSDGVTDYNDLQNKPDLSVYSLKADTYTKTEIDATTRQINGQIDTKASQSSLDAHTGNGTIHVTAADKTNWNGKANAVDVYNKTEIDSKVTTINNSIGTKANQTDLTTHTGNTTVHITAQERTSWNGKTTMADVEAKGYAVAADLATVANTGSYNDLSNKPTIPAAQVNSDWNAASGKAQILNKPSIPQDETDLGLTTEVWTFTMADNTTVRKTVVIK